MHRLTDHLGELHPADARHLHVHQHDVGPECLDRLHGLGRIGDGRDRHSVGPEHGCVDLGRKPIVVDDQHRYVRGRLECIEIQQPFRDLGRVDGSSYDGRDAGPNGRKSEREVGLVRNQDRGTSTGERAAEVERGIDMIADDRGQRRPRVDRVADQDLVAKPLDHELQATEVVSRGEEHDGAWRRAAKTMRGISSVRQFLCRVLHASPSAAPEPWAPVHP